MPTLVLVAFAAVYVVWGSTYLAIRIGVESFPPLILAGLRHLIVGLFLYPVLRAKTGIRPTAANWRTAVVAGTLLSLSLAWSAALLVLLSDAAMMGSIDASYRGQAMFNVLFSRLGPSGVDLQLLGVGREQQCAGLVVHEDQHHRPLDGPLRHPAHPDVERLPWQQHRRLQR